MQETKDGVTLIADAIRAEMKADEEKKKATATTQNVADAVKQFATPAKTTPPADDNKPADTPPEQPADDNKPAEPDANNNNE